MNHFCYCWWKVSSFWFGISCFFYISNFEERLSRFILCRQLWLGQINHLCWPVCETIMFRETQSSRWNIIMRWRDEQQEPGYYQVMTTVTKSSMIDTRLPRSSKTQLEKMLSQVTQESKSGSAWQWGSEWFSENTRVRRLRVTLFESN